MLSIDPRTTADRAEAMRQMSEKIPDATAVAFLMQNLAVRNDHFDWQLNLPAIGAAIPELCAFPAELAARRFDGPAALITGSLSDYVTPADSAAFVEQFPRTQTAPAIGSTPISRPGFWLRWGWCQPSRREHTHRRPLTCSAAS
jgi:hypothetical protein